MATTESRTGFRLPWSADRTDDDASDQPTSAGVDNASADTDDGWPSTDRASATSAPITDDAQTPSTVAPVVTGPIAPARKPSKFMADLTRAMQAAAESAREATLSQFQADAKTYVEQIHDRSAGEATQLRQRADDDVTGIREWSKTEIARIRDETEQKITGRKARLEQEVEDHAALIERQIERIQGRVAEFESEMDRFFEHLLAETDPTRFAAMAESLPEPPEFDESFLAAAGLVSEVAAIAEAPEAGEATPAASARAAGNSSAETQSDHEAAFAAIPAAAEAAENGHIADATSVDTTAIATVETESDSESDAAPDPRLTALGLTPDFAAAEAEAFAAADALGEDFIPEIADDVMTGRIANLMPHDSAVPDVAAPRAPTRSTHVVVLGLVSVASIASFKRHLGRVPGVSSVGVSSGPDGEFVFTVQHDDTVALNEVVPTLSDFKARVTNAADGVVNVTASDPESES
jgi:hypothetical protein